MKTLVGEFGAIERIQPEKARHLVPGQLRVGQGVGVAEPPEADRKAGPVGEVDLELVALGPRGARLVQQEVAAHAQAEQEGHPRIEMREDPFAARGDAVDGPAAQQARKHPSGDIEAFGLPDLDLHDLPAAEDAAHLVSEVVDLGQFGHGEGPFRIRRLSRPGHVDGPAGDKVRRVILNAPRFHSPSVCVDLRELFRFKTGG